MGLLLTERAKRATYDITENKNFSMQKKKKKLYLID